MFTVLGSAGVAAACGCCGGVGIMAAAPEFALGYLLQEQPLAGRNMALPTMTMDERQALAADAADGTVELTPEQLLRMSSDSFGPETDVIELSVDPQNRLRLDMSVQTSESRWANIHSLATVEFNGGRVTSCILDELSIGPLDLGRLVAGEQLASHVQGDIDRRAALDPELSARMAAIEQFRVENGKIVVKLAPGGLEAFAAGNPN